MVFCDFHDFFWSGAPLSGNPAVECQKLIVFCYFFLVGCTPLRENEGRVSKTGVFLRFWGSRNCPENCAHDSFCLIRPFFQERKNERKSPKNVKNWGFLFEATLCGNPAVKCQKLVVFLRFFFGRVHPSQGKRGSSVSVKNWVFFCVFGGPETVLKTVLTIRFASYGRFLTPSRGEKRWFQTSLKPV